MKMKLTPMITIGIDYSLSCPCMCISLDGTYANSQFSYMTNNKKHADLFGRGRGYLIPEYSTEQERYENLADFFVEKIQMFARPSDCVITIEDYSFGSKGRVFHIAENCGLLKYKLWKLGYSFECVPPTVIKKFATGKGNATKEKMVEAFKELTGVDLHDEILKGKKLDSPVTDIVDSFYIASYGRAKLINTTS